MFKNFWCFFLPGSWSGSAAPHNLNLVLDRRRCSSLSKYPLLVPGILSIALAFSDCEWSAVFRCRKEQEGVKEVCSPGNLNYFSHYIHCLKFWNCVTGTYGICRAVAFRYLLFCKQYKMLISVIHLTWDFQAPGKPSASISVNLSYYPEFWAVNFPQSGSWSELEWRYNTATWRFRIRIDLMRIRIQVFL